VRSHESFAGDTLAYYASWVAWADLFEAYGIVKNDKFAEYKKYMRSGQFMGVYLDGLAVVCRRPAKVRRDDDLRLHHDQKPAIEWRDGYKLYFLHGQAFDEPLFNKIAGQKMTLKDVMDIKEEGMRTMAFSMLRPDRLLKAVGAVLINTGERGTKLYKVDNFATKVLGNTRTMADSTQYCMVMNDASTDRIFLEWTPPEVGKHGDADLCQAHAWGIQKEDYLLLGQEA
jgi:hypothetical protein